MKKPTLFLFSLILITFASCTRKSGGDAPKASFSVGFTVKNLSNPTWAKTAETLDELITADGGIFTYIDNQGNSNLQIQQVENFIANEVDAIIIQVAEENALADVLRQAMNAGIKIFCWDDDIKTSDVNWIIDNYEAGRIIGTKAADWINEKLGGQTEYAILSYDQEPILLERGNGIRDALKELAPNAVLVGDQPAVTPAAGMTHTETFLEAYPDLKVVASLGGGGAIGANNAFKAANKLSDDVGIFAADATAEEIAAIKNNEAIRMSVLFSGTPVKNGNIIYDIVKKLLAGDPVPRKIIRDMIPITAENVSIAED